MGLTLWKLSWIAFTWSGVMIFLRLPRRAFDSRVSRTVIDRRWLDEPKLKTLIDIPRNAPRPQ
jgi:hypothetical protein